MRVLNKRTRVNNPAETAIKDGLLPVMNDTVDEASSFVWFSSES
jgi:hypothetical protein